MQDTDNTMEYLSLKDAAKALGCSSANLSHHLKGKNPPPHKVIAGRPAYLIKELKTWWNSPLRRRRTKP